MQGGPTIQPGGMPAAPTEPPRAASQQTPFRIATLERTEMLQTEAGTIAANEQIFDRTTEGTGFVYGVQLNLTVTTSGNAAAVTFAEDGPWSALSTVIYRDTTGEVVNMGGFQLYLANIAQGNYRTTYEDASDTSGEFYAATTGGGGTGGSLLINLRVPIAINRRNLLGLLGNQDRGVKYQLRTNIAQTAQIYGVAPTTPGTFSLQKIYESYTVPSPVGAYGAQQITPDGFGTLHIITQNVSEAVPAPSVTLNHYMRRIGNMWRWVFLIFRSGSATPRATAQTNVNRLQLKVGDTDFFNEPYYYRRLLMWERYGYRLPVGTLLYDFMHDFLPAAGAEMGDDWLNTKDVNTAQFIITYNAGMTAGGTMMFLTDELALVGQPLGS